MTKYPTKEVLSREQSFARNLGYRYPYDFSLRPTAERHKHIVEMVMERARESQGVIKGRYDSWSKIDDTLTAYVDLSEDDEAVEAADKRKPTAFVVPTSYAIMETLLTYMASVFLEDPIFQYEAMSQEDISKAVLLQRVIALQNRRFKAAMALHTQWRDSFAYGFGAVSPRWVRRSRFTGEADLMDVASVIADGSSGTPGVLYEGNVIHNICPYFYLPDINTPIERPQEGEYVGWIQRTNYVSLMEQEGAPDSRNGLFNVRYMKEVNGKSTLFEEGRSGMSEETRDKWGTEEKVSRPIDIVWMYVKIIPREWRLGSEEYPRKWLFGVAGDELLVYAAPTNLEHDMFPVAVAAPDSDGRSVAPVSRMEIIYDLQRAIDWFMYSRVTNVRKAINDMLIVNPEMIKLSDLMSPKPGKIIRMKEGLSADITKAVHQLKIEDVTKTHITDMGVLEAMMQRVSAAPDILQGIMRKGPERMSATEARDTRAGALSRLEKAAMLISSQSMLDLGYLLAHQTQQLMDSEVLLRVLGDDVKELDPRLVEQAANGRLRVTADMISIPFDVVPKDGATPSGSAAAQWIQLFQTVTQNEVLMQSFNVAAMFRHIAHLLGAKNIDDFMMTPGDQGPSMKIMGDEAVADQVARGNVAPIREVAPDGVTTTAAAQYPVPG